MTKHIKLYLIAGAVLSFLSATFASDFLYVIANPAGPNYVAAYSRNRQSGALALLGSYRTGGAGSVDAQFVGAQQNSLVFSDGRLYAVNPGSNDISIFLVQQDGTLRLARAPVPSGGIGPETIAVHGRLLYVGNNGDANTPPNLTGFQIDGDDLHPIRGSTVILNVGDHPTDLMFSRNGSFLVASLAVAGIIDVFRVQGAGALLRTAELHDQPGIVGLAFNPVLQNKLIGSLANFPGVRSYSISSQGEITTLSSVEDDATIDSCWVVTDKAGTKAWISAPLSSSIVLYAIDRENKLTRLSSHDTSSSGFTLTDLAIDESESFLYAVKPLSARVHSFRLTGDESEAGVADAGNIAVPAPPGGAPYAPFGIVLVHTDDLNPHEGFTNASLNGAYAISFSGKDSSGFFAIGGTFTADGHGRITSGVLDVNSARSPVTNVPVTGTYNIQADGRGTAAFTSSAGNFSLVFVALSGKRALVTRFEQSATGSGALDLQNSSAFSTSALAGTLVFNLTGPDVAGNPMKAVGSFTSNTSGRITAGVQDSSDNGAISMNEAIGGGSFQVATNGRGTASINTAAGVRNFAFYVVDADRIKMLETDALPALAGDAFRQSGSVSNASLNGASAFTVSGNNGVGPFVAGGVFSSDGAGTITSGKEDFNQIGSTMVNIGVSGTYALDASGRGTGTINNGAAGMLNLALYPTINGIQVLETDSGKVVSGAIFPQSDELSSTNLQGSYGFNYTGASLTARGEVDAVASLTANGRGGITGLVDINDVGSISSGTSLNGSYSLDSSGRGSLTLQSEIGQQNAAIYAVSGNQALFIDLDQTLIAVGVIEHQVIEHK